MRRPPASHPAPVRHRSRLILARLSQSFAWLARSKHVFRRMNQARFLFTMLRLMDKRNRFLCSSGVQGRT